MSGHLCLLPTRDCWMAVELENLLADWWFSNGGSDISELAEESTSVRWADLNGLASVPVPLEVPPRWPTLVELLQKRLEPVAQGNVYYFSRLITAAAREIHGEVVGKFGRVMQYYYLDGNVIA